MFSVVSVSLSVVTTADLFELVHLGTLSPPLGLLFTCCQYINWSMSGWPLTERPFFLSPTNEVWGKLNVFTDVCLSTGGRGSPWRRPPPDREPPPGQIPPCTVKSWQYAPYRNAFLLPATTKLGQGNVFTGICDSVHTGGVCLSASWDTITPQADPPGADTPPGSRLRHQRAAGTHPTGMHSC